MPPDLQVGQTVARRLHQGRRRLGEPPGHFLDADQCLVVGPFHALVGAVVVDGVDDQVHLMRPVVQHRDLGCEHHHQFGKPEVVDAGVRQCFQSPHHVVAEIADHPGVERWQPLGGRGGKFGEGLAQDIERVAVADAGQFAAQPDGLPAALREGGGATHPDEGVPGPHPLRRGFQQERSLPCPAQGGVQADRGDVIGQQTGVDADHAAGSRQLRELCKGWRDVQHSTSLPVSSVKKQLGLPVWQAAPVCSTRSSTVSPSQSR